LRLRGTWLVPSCWLHVHGHMPAAGRLQHARLLAALRQVLRVCSDAYWIYPGFLKIQDCLSQSVFNRIGEDRDERADLKVGFDA